MFKGTVMCVPRCDAIVYAAENLASVGIHTTDRAGPDVTHLLLPVPSFSESDTYLAHILAELPDHVIVSGGSLHSPLLEHYRVVDFLQDPFYLAENAGITARCAMRIIEAHIDNIRGLPVLILGWGRIGKCLGRLLREKGADVTVGSRKPRDVAILRALGYGSEFLTHVRDTALRYKLIINTVPDLILPNLECSADTLVMELASRPGITGPRILTARGLPGKMAPEESGHLIAKTFIRLSI